MSALQLAGGASVAAAIAYLAALAIATIVTALRTGGRREEAADRGDLLAGSRLTMPVTIVVPAGRSHDVPESIAALLDLHYGELEVIVVLDERAIDVERLVSEWQLESREFFYRRALETAPVRRIFRSLRDPRVIVVEKEGEAASDALNCGVNFARYRYVAVVPPSIRFERSALLGAITPALLDPVTVVGIASPIERIANRESIDRPACFQRLRSIRGLMFARLFWSRLRRAVGSGDSVLIWRRDALLQANGFSNEAADPVLDMIFRLQRSSGEERRIVCNAEAFGSAPTLPAAEVPAARLARLRSVVATVASWGPSAGRTIGGRAFVLFLESELVTPLAQCWVVAATAAGAALGWCSWLVPVAMLLLLAFGTSAVTAAALLTRGAFDGAPDAAELRRLVVLAPLEFLIVRPTQAAALLFAPFFTSDRTESAD